MKRISGILAVLIASTLLAAAGAEENLYLVESRIDWIGRTIEIDASLDLKKAGIRMPAGRSQAELFIARDLADITRESFFSLTVNSRETVESALNSREITPDDLKTILESAEPSAKRFSDDMKRFSVRLTFGFSEFERLFVRHSGAFFQPGTLEYRPTRDYTGIVIIAKGKLPVHGEHLEDVLKPAFFPRIFDSSMAVILEKNMVRPEAIAKWGLVGYAHDPSGTMLEKRVGGSPLRILAEGAFGTNRTDVIINREDSLKIISSPANRNLIAEGKIVLVIDETD